MNKPNFSSNQILAINHFTGPALVVAGPGSGKTTVITNRINFLIYQKQIKPENILVITFSKMAAISMQSRFNQSNTYLPVNFGTFHSVFFNILKQSSTEKNYKVASRKDKQAIILNILKNKSFIDNTEPEFIDSIIKRISFYKNTGLNRDNAELCSIKEELFSDIFIEYQDNLRAINMIDFEDMMLKCKELLLNPIIREKYRQKFKFILIDEFQDINDLQFEIIKLLVYEDNIFAVGDDDQSIYGFRGSNPNIMCSFQEHFPKAQIIHLDCNYRCANNIVSVASALIKNNTNRVDKSIYTNNPAGSDVRLNSYITKDDELQSICQIIKNDNLSGNIGILFRNNISASRMIEMLLNNGIHCEVTEKIKNPFDNTIVRDFIHYMNLASDLNSMESVDFLPIMNKPVRYISRSMINGKYVDLTLLMALNKERDYISRNIWKLTEDLKRIRNMDIYSAFNYFRFVIGYESFEMKNGNRSGNELKNIFDDLQDKMKMFNSLDKLCAFINEFDDINNKSEAVKVKEDGVYVMTYHASKGLEFDNLFLPNLIEGEIPSSKSVTAENIEEERRMLYVAITRAKKQLYISYTKDRENKHIMSRFLYDIINEVNCIKY